MRFHRSSILLLLCVTLGGAAGRAQATPLKGEGASPDPLASAAAAGTHWLNLVDAGDYRRAWQSASTMMRSALPEEQAVAMYRNAREPLGRERMRVIKSASATTTLPGAPDGHYAVIEYQTRFQNKAEAIEKLVEAQEPDGTWKVIGFFIR